MKLFLFSLLLGLSSALDFSKVKLGLQHKCGDCQPQQVHIAFGEKVNEIVVTWSTFDDTQESIVEYGEGLMDRQATGSSKLFVDGGWFKRRQYIHTVTLRDLKFNTSYVYHVGSVYGWSDEFWFRTVPAGEAWPVRAAIYGDMGSANAQVPYYYNLPTHTLALRDIH